MDAFNLQLQNVSLQFQINDLQNQINAFKLLQNSITNIQPTSEPDEKLPIQRCRWTFQEDQLLLQLVRTHGLTCYKTLAKHMEGKKPAQVYFKLRHLKQLYETHKDDTRVYNMNKKWFQYFKSCNC
ncbi:SANT/Myb_domain [Hexamita inflata]|uniref:SANT/Myb domain n=1 Tax=Hexamita inflata TaxID=28002 RepID=A0AA86RAU6_9EUKA|nr:SANT/Myb domain [Hexamita inflata]